jgi:PBP1b-binding outer membrane lipoprotein LpoB
MLGHMKKNIRQVIIPLLIFLLSGCASKTEYLSYKDKNGKGMEVFDRDLKYCQNYSRENEKQIEGSKGAGERFQYKNSIFLLCMKNKDWTLRK